MHPENVPEHYEWAEENCGGAVSWSLFFREIEEEGRKILRPCPDKKRGHELLHGLESILWMMLSWRACRQREPQRLFSRSCGNRGNGSGRFWGVLQTDVKNGGFLRFVGAGHVVVAQGRDDKQYRHESGHLGQQTARTGAAEYGGVAAAENDAHSFLARLEQDKDNEGYTYDDMQGKNQGLHGGNSSAGWTMPALNRLCQ